MRVEKLKRWHWALIGCFLGLVVAWTWGSIQDSGGFTDAATLGADEFERLLREGPMQRHPRIKDITLHQDGGRYWVTLKVLGPDPKDPHPKNPRRYRYLREQLNATTPFMPDFRDSPTQTVMVRVNPSAVSKAHGLRRHEDEGALALWVNGAAAQTAEIAGRLHLEGWQIQTGQWADPQASARMELSLRPADYQLMIVLHADQDPAPAASDLSVKMNGHDVPLSGPVATSSGPAFKATILRAWFVAGPLQTLEISRGARPAKIWEVRLIDPTYSVADYLAFLKQARPDLSFGSAWWERAWVRLGLCAGAGGVLLAALGPWLVLLFTGPLDRSPDRDYDLGRFKGEQAKKSPAPVIEDELDLAALEAKVAEGLAPGAAIPASQAASPPPPPKLGREPDRMPLIEADKDPEEYAGEFYPVARHSTHKHDQHHGSD
jgi:hypothetical protein